MAVPSESGKAETAQMEEGSQVIVETDFVSRVLVDMDRWQETSLKSGMRGQVILVDKAGDAYISFEGLESCQWVKRCNFENLVTQDGRSVDNSGAAVEPVVVENSASPAYG